MQFKVNFIVSYSIAIIGSGMFQVLYSCVTIWCALISWLFLKKQLSTFQWFCIFIVNSGLYISTMGVSSTNECKYLIKHSSILSIGNILQYTWYI